MNAETSLGLIETKGLIGAITAADAMAKAAAVTLTRRHRPGGARMVVMCRGDLASCAAAVAAGATAAAEVGELVCSTVLARPEEGAEVLCGELLDENTARRAAQKAACASASANAPAKAAPISEPERPQGAPGVEAATRPSQAEQTKQTVTRKPSGKRGK
jgi:ethanolamine utilization protein EutM